MTARFWSKNTNKIHKTLKKPAKTLKKSVEISAKFCQKHLKSDCQKVLMFHLSQNPNLKKVTDNFIAYVNP
jgi:hypothetical protein